MMSLLPPDPTAYEGTTNAERADWAEVALLAFGHQTGVLSQAISDREDPFLVVADFLADLAHWCDRNNVDLQSTIRYATRHYHTETGSEGKQLSERHG